MGPCVSFLGSKAFLRLPSFSHREPDEMWGENSQNSLDTHQTLMSSEPVSNMQDFTATVITLVLVHRCSSRYQSWNKEEYVHILWSLNLSQQVSGTPLSSGRRSDAHGDSLGGAMEGGGASFPWRVTAFYLQSAGAKERLSISWCQTEGAMLPWPCSVSPPGGRQWERSSCVSQRCKSFKSKTCVGRSPLNSRLSSSCAQMFGIERL